MYFYAPLYSGAPQVTQDTILPDGSEGPALVTLDFRTQPGQDSGSGPVYLAAVPVGLACLHYDTTATRVVCRLTSLDPVPPGWVAKTQAEVQADYPSLGV